MSDIVDIANNIAAHAISIKLQNHITPSPTPNIECIECGAEIGAARKAAVPHATRCIDCQEAKERRL